MKLPFVCLTLLSFVTYSYAGGFDDPQARCACIDYPFSDVLCKDSDGSCKCLDADTSSDEDDCDFQECCTRRQSHWPKEGDRLLNVGEPDYHAYLETCGALEYDTSFYVAENTHLYAVFSPKEEAVAASCPYVAVHSSFNQRKGFQKKFIIWEDKEKGKGEFEDGGFIPVGTYKFSELTRAFEDAETSPSSVYDVVTSNCGNFIVSFASNLGVKIDSQVTSFVARRLIEVAGEEFSNSIRESSSYLSLFDGHHRHVRAENLNDDELVTLLVEKHAAPLY